MAEEPAVTCQVAGAVARITLNRPRSRNALSAEVTSGLLGALGRADADEAVRVAVLTGAGERAFCAGGDLSSLGALGSARRPASAQRPADGDAAVPGGADGAAPGGPEGPAPGGRGTAPGGQGTAPGGPERLFHALREFGKPLIARLAGHALGGGLGLAVSCDLAIAADDVKLGTPEINVGLWPMMIMAVLGPNIAPKQAFKLYCTGEPVSAAEAVRIGLLTEAVPRERLDERVDELAGLIATKSPAALRMGRAAFHEIDGMQFGGQISHLSGKLAELAGTEDAQEGIAAFLEKRPPRFTGR
jgi:enoyl-CoA hydratase/carnithine racemase